ncbi:hypothetical protein X975_25422, partial [Stegodyphus mimosarum]
MAKHTRAICLCRGMLPWRTFQGKWIISTLHIGNIKKINQGTSLFTWDQTEVKLPVFCSLKHLATVGALGIFKLSSFQNLPKH